MCVFFMFMHVAKARRDVCKDPKDPNALIFHVRAPGTPK